MKKISLDTRQPITTTLKAAFYAHPYVFVAASLIFFNIIIILIFSAILAITSGQNFFDALTYCFILTMSSDGIYDFNLNKDVQQLVIKIIMILIQMILFSGALIGFVTSVLQNFFDKKLNNRGSLVFKDHYVILNWSSLGPNLIYDLNMMEEKCVVVILCQTSRQEVIDSIKNIFIQNNIKNKNVRFFVKRGDPFSLKDLNDIHIQDAKCVGLLLSSRWENSEKVLEGCSARDLNAFKLLMSILHLVNVKSNSSSTGKFFGQSGATKNVVVEVENNTMAKKIEATVKNIGIADNCRISTFSHHSILGHIIGKTLIHSTYSDFYYEVLSYEGVEFYPTETCDIDEALQKYNDCIPIVNYDDNNNGKLDQLYVLSRDQKNLGTQNRNLKYNKPLPYNKSFDKKKFTIFIIGKNNIKKYFDNEINNYKANYDADIKIVNKSYDEIYKEDGIDNLIETINSTPGQKKLLLLSNSDEENSTYDTDIFLTLLKIRGENKIDKDVSIFAEIKDPKNKKAIENLQTNKVIISNSFISLYMVQLLTHPDSSKFYEDVISSTSYDNDGLIDFEVHEACHLLDLSKESIRFKSKSELIQRFYYASNKEYILLGIREGSKPIQYLCDDMDAKWNYTVKPNHKFILAKTKNKL